MIPYLPVLMNIGGEDLLEDCGKNWEAWGRLFLSPGTRHAFGCSGSKSNRWPRQSDIARTESRADERQGDERRV